jgi:hypothetical protein
MANPYIPNRDPDFDDWLLNFSTLLTASPATYGLIAADAVNVAAAYTSWHTAFLAAIAGPTRGPMSIAAKDTARVATLGVVRPYAQLISLNAGVMVEDKIAIGVNARTNTPTPIPAPTTYPVLSVIGITYLQTTLRYRNDGAPETSRAKPANVMQIQIFGATSTTVISDPSALPLKSTGTKVPLVLGWDSSEVGKTAYLSGRWINRNGLVGPFSPIMPVVVG